MNNSTILRGTPTQRKARSLQQLGLTAMSMLQEPKTNLGNLQAVVAELQNEIKGSRLPKPEVDKFNWIAAVAHAEGACIAVCRARANPMTKGLGLRLPNAEAKFSQAIEGLYKAANSTQWQDYRDNRMPHGLSSLERMEWLRKQEAQISV